MKETKKQISFVKGIILAALCAVEVVGICLVITFGVFISTRTNEDYIAIAQTTCAHIVAQINLLDEGDFSYDEVNDKMYKGKTEITDAAFWAIHNSNSDIVHTLFWGDTQVLTDVSDHGGNSVKGTKLTDGSIMEAVQKNGHYTANNDEIYGNKYSVCYMPLRNGSQIVGYMFVGIDQGQANKIIIRDVIIMILIALSLAGVATVLMIRILNRKSKEFHVNLNEVSTIAKEKKDNVTDLGMSTREDMEQINLAIDQVSLAVTEQASQTEEIMGSMEEFAASIDVIMQEVDSTSSVATDSIKLIEELKDQLHALEEVSAENSKGIATIAKQVEQDGEAVANISKIIDVINSIAFQITILSFNASVEAARAGEAGKGFAVVADSIKDLSDKTKDSLEEITRIVFAVNQEMNETIQSSENLIEENNKVVEALNITKERMNGVAESFDQIVNNIESIKNESGIITDSKNQVVERVSSLAATSEQNAAMGEEMKASADEVISTTGHLLGEINRLQDINRIIDTVIEQFSHGNAAK